jgi:hypothetical protein
MNKTQAMKCLEILAHLFSVSGLAHIPEVISTTNVMDLTGLDSSDLSDIFGLGIQLLNEAFVAGCTLVAFIHRHNGDSPVAMSALGQFYLLLTAADESLKYNDTWTSSAAKHGTTSSSELAWTRTETEGRTYSEKDNRK